MTQNYFGDTSAIIKLYHNEVGSDWMENLFNDQTANLIISELTTIEVSSALARRLRRGEITNHAYQMALKNFEQDCANRFRMTPLTSKVVEIARNLIHQHGGNQLALRTLDALTPISGWSVS